MRASSRGLVQPHGIVRFLALNICMLLLLVLLLVVRVGSKINSGQFMLFSVTVVVVVAVVVWEGRLFQGWHRVILPFLLLLVRRQRGYERCSRVRSGRCCVVGMVRVEHWHDHGPARF